MLTAGNLACGILGILLVLEQGVSSFPSVGFLVLAAGVLDFFDGFVARLLKSTSAIGKDLDSLADLVTFGVLPTIMVYAWCQHLAKFDDYSLLMNYSAISIGIFSAVRLAIFNNDSRQSDQFFGVPTPANAFFIVFLVISQSSPAPEFVFTRVHWLLITATSSFLLVSPFPLIALKFKDYSFGNNWPRYVVLIAAVLGLLFFSLSAIPGIILLYIVISFLSNSILKWKNI